MTRDVLLDLELDEEDDEDGDIGEPGVPMGRRPRIPGRKPRAHAEEVGDSAGRFAGTLGRSEERRRAGARGREKEARAAVRGAALRTPGAADRGRLPAALAEADGPRGGRGGAGRAGAPRTDSGRERT